VPVPGPNGPLPWQLQNIKLLVEGPSSGGGDDDDHAGDKQRENNNNNKKKRRVVAPGHVLLGLNFYGCAAL